MSVRPRPGAEVPALTARIARASNPGGTTAMWVRDRLDGLWQDEDFAGWYSRDGRPGLSPAQLATVSVLQFVLDLSDRQAAGAVRCRTGFKYALGLEPGDPGFHHSVLTDFRDRLAEDGRCGVPIIHPCWSGSMPVLVEGAAEPVASADVEVRDLLRIGNRFG